MYQPLFVPALIVAALVVFFLMNAIRILAEYERGVIFRLGRYVGTKGPGLILLIPVVDRMVRVDLRVLTMDVPSQDVITKDNVTVKVNAVIYFRVMIPENAIIEVENFLYATSQLAQTTLRSVCGEAELDELLGRREKLNIRIQEILDAHTGPWGMKVSNVAIKYIDLPQEMQRMMARQAEAEREKRAKVIHAEGEYLAAERLTGAAKIISTTPSALQLRFLQTVTEVASEKTSVVVLPVPLELFRGFMTQGNGETSA
jgi:regulator of protease activity HflC (stomatin/prohibitin superfamily)